jgi:hypothetical protein
MALKLFVGARHHMHVGDSIFIHIGLYIEIRERKAEYRSFD